MIKQIKNRVSLRFRRWSRKSYAIFQSLGRVVTIGSLRKSAIEMSEVKEGDTGNSQLCLSSNKDNGKDDGLPCDDRLVSAEELLSAQELLSIVSLQQRIAVQTLIEHEVSQSLSDNEATRLYIRRDIIFTTNSKRSTGTSRIGAPLFNINRYGYTRN